MAHDPVASYFTSDRIAELHDLRAGFPLWCGLWPSPHDSSIERTQWSARSLVQAEAEDITEQVRSQLPSAWRNSKRLVPVVTSVPTPDSVPLVSFAISKFPSPPVPKTFSPRIHWVRDAPPILTALLRARWLITWSEAIRNVWILRLTERLKADVPYLGDLPSQTTTTDPLPFAFFAELAWGGPLEDPQRGHLSEQAQNEWIELGREVGILPKIERRRRITLSPDFLNTLFQEGQRLVQSVAEDEPEPDDLDAVLSLLGHPAASLGDVEEEFRRLAARSEKAQKARAQREADNRRTRRVEEAVRESPEIRQWARRLRYPMLSAAEFDLITSNSKARRSRRARIRPSQKILAGRLRVTVRTIQNHLSSYRRDS